MSLSLSLSSVVEGTTSLDFICPTVSAGDLIVVMLSGKRNSSTGTISPDYTNLDPTYSLEIYSSTKGSGAPGTDCARVTVEVAVKVSDGTEGGPVSIGISNAPLNAVGVIIVVHTSQTIDYELLSGGFDSTAGTSWSATSSPIGSQTGDIILAASGINQDARSWGSGALSQSGATFGASGVLVDAYTALGDHSGLVVWEFDQTAGSSSAAATYTMTGSSTFGSGPVGPTTLLRVREVTVAEPIGPPDDVTVGAGFGYDPFDPSPTYTDISAYIDAKTGIDITRGRTDALSQPSAGTCTFLLDNSDGRFTPGNTSGPYGTDVKVRTPIQVTVPYGGVDRVRFTGFVQSWDLMWPGGVTESAKVRVVAADLLAILADTPTRPSMSDTMLHTDPVALYPLTERERPCFDIGDYDQHRMRFTDRGGPAGSVLMGQRDGEFPSHPKMRTVYVKAGSLDADSRMAWAGLAADLDYQSASTHLGFGGWVKWDADVPTVRGFIASLELNATYSLLLWQDPDNGLCCGVGADRASTPTISVPGGRITDGRWHFVYAVYEHSSYQMTLYVDGDSLGTSATGLSAPSGSIGASGRFLVGGADFPATLPAYTAMPRGWLSHWGVWTDAAAAGLDTDEIWTEGKDRERPRSRSSDRIDWMLDKVGWPTAPRNIETGVATIPSAGVDRSSALAYLQSCADAELGVLFVHRNGKAAFHARPHRYATSTTSSGTLSWHEVGQEWATDVDSVRNIVTVGFVGGGGGQVTVRDPASQAAYGHRTADVSGGLLNGHQAHGAAQYALGLLAEPQPRMSPFRWNLTTCPTQVDNELVLDLDIGDRFTVSAIPSPAHVTSADFWVEQLAEHISIDDWSVTVTTSPWVEMFPSGTWVLGVSTLGDDTILSY